MRNFMNTVFINKQGIVILASVMLLLTFVACQKKNQAYVDYTNNAGIYDGDALSYFQSQKGVYDSMLLVIDRLGSIADSVKNGNYTIFAPSNRSFSIALENINQARRDSVPQLPPLSLSTMDVSVLDTFFCKYIIPGKIRSTDLSGRADGLEYGSIKYDYPMQLQYRATNASGYLSGGPKAIIFSDRRGSVFTVNWIRVSTITVDIQTNNAIVHALDPGHTFGFGNDLIRSLNRR